MRYSGKPFDSVLRKELDIKNFECFQDPSDSYINAMFSTNNRCRVTYIKAKIDQYNQRKLTDENKIIIRQQSEFDDAIMTLSRSSGQNLKSNGFYARIQTAKERGDPTYYCWPRNSAEMRERELNKELFIDMVIPFNESVNPPKNVASSGSQEYYYKKFMRSEISESVPDNGNSKEREAPVKDNTVQIEVEVSKAPPFRPRIKRMARRIYESDSDDENVHEKNDGRFFMWSCFVVFLNKYLLFQVRVLWSPIQDFLLLNPVLE